MDKLRNWMKGKMAGRNGMDPLGYVTVVLYVLMLLWSNLVTSWIPLILCLLFIAFGVFRFLSKNLTQREKENEALLGLFRPIGRLFRKKYKVYQCKNCGTKVKQKKEYQGEITCPKCKRRIR